MTSDNGTDWMTSRLGGARRDAVLEARLARWIPPGRIGRPIYAYPTVSSTMDVARRLAEQGGPDGALVWAKRQEQGRGRFGRTWSSPEGGAYWSFLLRPRVDEARLPQLSLVAGLAVAEAVARYATSRPTIRWPNDVLVDDRKVAGVLVEAHAGAAIVGIGINVAPTAPLPGRAASLAEAWRIPRPDPCEVTGLVCRRFRDRYETWAGTGKGFAPLRDVLRQWLGGLGQPVRVSVGTVGVEGRAVDLDEGGRLIVQTAGGTLRAFEAGEVTCLRDV